jgi:hypothetical protein
MALDVVMLLYVVAALGGGVVATLCCRPIILLQYKGIFGTPNKGQTLYV